MKKDEIYPYYLLYLESRLQEGRLSKGSFNLMKLSRSAFDDFKYRFEKDELFRKKQIDLVKTEQRDKKIDDIFDDLD